MKDCDYYPQTSACLSGASQGLDADLERWSSARMLLLLLVRSGTALELPVLRKPRFKNERVPPVKPAARLYKHACTQLHTG